jgi:hypothetical protein
VFRGLNGRLRNRTDATPSCAGTNQLPNERLKFDAGSELRSVGRNLVKVAAAVVIVIEIAEAKFGIDAPGDLAAERTVGLHVDGMEPTSKPPTSTLPVR